MSRRTARLLTSGPSAALLGIAVFAFIFRNALFAGETFVSRDLARFYRPTKSLLVPLTRASSGLPLWNPFFHAGQPFAANPHHELFHPLTTLYFLLPFEVAFRLEVMLPLALGGLAMAFLLRALRRSRPAAVFGAIAYAASGGLVSATNLMPTLLAFAALPLFAGFAARAARGGRGLDVVGAAVGLGFVALSGELAALLLAGAIAAIACAEARGPDGARPRWAAVALALALGAAVGAAALLPGWSLARKTARGALSPQSAQTWALPAGRLAEAVLPRVFGHLDGPDDRWYWGRARYPGYEYPFVFSLYPGLAVALLLPAGLARSRSARLWSLAALAGLALALAALPVFGWTRAVVPFLSAVRFPERFAMWAVLAVPVAASAGLDAVRRARDGRRGLVLLAALVGCAAAVASLVALLLARSGASPVFWMSTESGLPTATLGRLVAGDLARQALVALAVVLAAWRLRPRGFVAALVALTAVDLAEASRPLVPTADARTQASPPLFLKPALEPPLDGPLFHAAAWEGRRGARIAAAAPPIPVQWGIPLDLEADYDQMELSWSERATRLFFEAVSAAPELGVPLAARRGIAGVVRFSATAAHPDVVRLVRHRPFAFLAGRVVRIDAPAEWPRAVRELGAARDDAAVVENAEPISEIPERPAGGLVSVRSRRADEIALDVRGDGPGASFVCLAQTWDSGWSARVDGKAARLVRTDVSLSGLVVPAGAHRVDLVYRDPVVSLGIGISLAALAVCLLLARVPTIREPPYFGNAPWAKR